MTKGQLLHQTRFSNLKEFSYSPIGNNSGIDEFELGFGNNNQRVKFVIEIINTDDQPIVESLRVFDDEGVVPPVELDPAPVDNRFLDLNLSETINRIYEVTFSDNQDFDDIVKVDFFGEYQNLFKFEEVVSEESKPWEKSYRISLINLLNREDYPRDSKIAFPIKALVEDNSANYPQNQNIYEFQFILPDENEPPEIKLNGLSPLKVFPVVENQTVAIQDITAVDPEGMDKNFTWQIIDEQGDGTMFELSSNKGDSVTLSFKEGMLPNFEKEEDKDLNLTINVSDGTLFDFKFISLKVKDDNDPPLNIVDTLSVFEPEQLVVDDLKTIFVDEDGDDLNFRLLSGDAYGKHSAFFNAELVKEDGILQFNEASDHERNSEYLITIRVLDDLVSTDTNITIEVENTDEPPQVRFRDGEDGNFSYENKVISSYTFGVENNEFLQEDIRYEIKNLYFLRPGRTSTRPQNPYLHNLRGT